MDFSPNFVVTSPAIMEVSLSLSSFLSNRYILGIY